MISATQWEAYNKAVAKITDEAKDATSKQLASWLAEHDATVAEARAAAQRILAANAELYSQQAAALAAEWYDAQGKATGMKLDRAVTSVTVDRDSLSKTVRYQAQKLIDGDVGGFCDAVGEWAENEAKRALNATIMANAKRDRRKGVRFARVTSGRNTCAFCLMLAGRGAVYHTRQSAGELNRFHRHCSCKIVPCYSGNKYEVLVEGHDPKEAKRLWSKVAELDAMDGVAANLKQAAKDLISVNVGLDANDALAITERLGGRVPPASDEIAEWPDGKKFSKHVKKHAAAFGFDFTTAEGRAGYDRLFSDTMDTWDAVAFDDDFGGQRPNECVFYFKGDTIAIVNTVTAKRVSLFRHERGVSEHVDRIWDKAHGGPRS